MPTSRAIHYKDINHFKKTVIHRKHHSIAFGLHSFEEQTLLLYSFDACKRR